MIPEKATYAMMAASAGLLARVPTSRIFPGIIPLNSTLPAIAYGIVSDFEETAIGMTKLKDRARVQITVAVLGTNATSYKALKEIVDLVIAACNHKRGTFGSVAIDSSIKELVGPDVRDDQAGISYQSVDFRIAY
jgi:hypothetical protein